jgi:CspA family cold shock protein
MDLSANLKGRVKWFDSTKGFGFLVVDDHKGDVLLHANVLRNFGRGSVVEGTEVEFEVQETDKGRQVSVIHNIDLTIGQEETIDEGEEFGIPDVSGVEVVPARVKWFDKAKGFGFANVFKSQEDIFLHMEILRHFGFSDLQPGEAIVLQVVDGPRGKMAGSIFSWDNIPYESIS